MNKISEIDKMLGFKKVIHNPFYTGISYCGVFCTGDFREIGDYGKGLLKISVGNHHKGQKCVLTISTIDDGCYKGYGDSEVDIEKFVEDFHENFGNVLPQNEIFADFLLKYGMYGKDES